MLFAVSRGNPGGGFIASYMQIEPDNNVVKREDCKETIKIALATIF